ncbi:TPA: hypothetical protein O6B67_002684 [Staphylococcus aureus]|uniref:Conjugal transfer protein TraO n=3 Tax=Staphylococcus TaxID=1279 RepID=A0A0N9NHY2_STAPS|nr:MULTISPECIES: hypothetical protein [Staphylococcus]MDW4416826.1 hypothetical protein [Staphylococcus saprophyticus]ADM29097.1 Conjugal transfer protein traO [Staphylococcus aureus]ALG87915.1 conjugal transfer protein TraO [Staphylococcus pseudintermedius]EHT90514.1 conjugal transfer protein traO [Staphylococcus aureus subsp. aureus CIGC128]EUL08094.1 transfer complex protein TraO [Staphylococcus aureus M0444]
MKVTNTIRFEEEKKNLIDNVVNTLEEYKDVIDSELRTIRNTNHLVMRNNFNAQYSVHRQSSKMEDIDPLESLKVQLNSMGNGYTDIKLLKDSFENFQVKYEAYSDAVRDLIHFYKVSGVLNKEILKIRQLNKCLKPLTEGTSEKADLNPLLELEGAFNAINDFNDFKNLERVEYLLEKDEEGNIKTDKNGQYTVDREYFISRVVKLKNNLKKKYEINQKAIAKLYRKHNTSDRLKRYLEFGRH